MRKRLGLGAVATVLGLVLAVVAVPPGSWMATLSSWGSVASHSLRYVVVAAVAVVVGVLIGRWRRGGDPPQEPLIRVLTHHDYTSGFRVALESGAYNLVKLFGYTSEVISNDLMKFEDRYRDDLEFRILNRSWLVERVDEDAANVDAERRGVPQWKKAEAIEAAAKISWPHPLRRVVRYYDHQPIFRGSVLFKPDGASRTLYLGVILWNPAPKEGGSHFKSVNSPVIEITDDGGLLSRVIDAVDSQFEYDWRHAASKESLLDKSRTKGRSSPGSRSRRATGRD